MVMALIFFIIYITSIPLKEIQEKSTKYKSGENLLSKETIISKPLFLTQYIPLSVKTSS